MNIGRHVQQEFGRHRVRHIDHMRVVETMTATREWRCFHCDESFSDRDAAADHFGHYETDRPACKLDGGLVKMLREQEAELRRYRQDDSDMARLYYALGGEHHLAKQRAEEAGYAKGLKDAAPYMPDREEKIAAQDARIAGLEALRERYEKALRDLANNDEVVPETRPTGRTYLDGYDAATFDCAEIARSALNSAALEGSKPE